MRQRKMDVISDHQPNLAASTCSCATQVKYIAKVHKLTRRRLILFFLYLVDHNKIQKIDLNCEKECAHTWKKTPFDGVC